MQRRLLISTLVVAVVAVLLLGVPLAFDLSRLRTGQASHELRHEASYIATGLQDRYDSGLPADAAQVAKSLSDRYVTVVERPGGRLTEGTVYGQLTGSPRGSNGFGYDPIFVPDGFEVTTAQMSADEKDKISHRGQALRALAPVIAELLGA